MRRFLLWALEHWTGDRYVRVSLLREALLAAGAGKTVLGPMLKVMDSAIKWADDRERGAS